MSIRLASIKSITNPYSTRRSGAGGRQEQPTLPAISARLPCALDPRLAIQSTCYFILNKIGSIHRRFYALLRTVDCSKIDSVQCTQLQNDI